MTAKITKMPRRVKIILGAILLLFLAASGGRAVCAYRQPLGPGLDLPTPTAEPSPASTAETGAAGTTPKSTAIAQPLCGGPAVMTILAIGSDARANNYLYGLADIIRIVRVDFVTPRVTILEIPRDLWVEIPGISGHYGITHGKLNQAYFYGNPGMGYYDGPGDGPGLLARTLELNFGIRPDHYIAVNMQTFVNLVDSLGGIDVYLPYDIDTSSPENPNGFGVEAGQHHFDGQTALMVARIRQYTVFGRAENQNIILCALRKKLLSPQVVPKIPEIIQDFQRYTQTDFSPQDLSQLTCLANQVQGADIVFASFPVELFTKSSVYDPMLRGNVFVFDVDFDVLRGYVDRFNQGIWPDPAQVIANTPSPGEPDSGFTCDD